MNNIKLYKLLIDIFIEVDKYPKNIYYQIPNDSSYNKPKFSQYENDIIGYRNDWTEIY